MVYGVIAAGGAGTRLWPESRRASPKHTLRVGEAGLTLLEETYSRLEGVVERTVILTEAAQAQQIRSTLPTLQSDQLIIEPEARGTLNALGLAALTLAERDPDASMLTVWADHLIRPVEAFAQAAAAAVAASTDTGKLVVTGLKPRFAATGYGYIRTGEPAGGSGRLFKALEFAEKPDPTTAESYLAAGNYLWNLGLFAWRCSAFIAELKRLAPSHFEGLEQVLKTRAQGDNEAAARLYAQLPVETVEYGVLQKSGELLVLGADFDWIDVGSWSEIYELWTKDGAGNAVRGEALLLDTHGSLVFGDGRLVAAIGLEDMIVVAVDDAVLVCPKSRAQDVKKVVEQLRQRGDIRYL